LQDNTIYDNMYIVGKYKINLHSLRYRSEKLAKFLLFYLFLKLLQQIFYFPTMYVYCICISFKVLC